MAAATILGKRLEWLEGASIVDRDWMQTPSLPWERIPVYMHGEVKSLAVAGIPTPLSEAAPPSVNLSRIGDGWTELRKNKSTEYGREKGRAFGIAERS